MSAQASTSDRRQPATIQPESPPRALRIVGLVGVGLGVAALATATFVLSYSAIHVLALRAGVAPRLARGYPLLIDAMLVIVLAAVLALRGASLPSRLLAWGTLLAVLGAAAGADALHAAGRELPQHVAAIAAAVLPWVLVFLAFALLLSMLRYARLRRVAAEPPAEHPDLAAAAVIGEPAPVAAPDDWSDDASSDPTDGIVPDEADDTDPENAVLSPVPAAEDEQEEPEMPVFHRMWSSPTPPAGY